MSAADNKRLMQEIFAEVAKGNGAPFVDAMADDIRWTVTGTTPWSRTFTGKTAVLNDLFRPILDQFAGQYVYSVSRFMSLSSAGATRPRPANPTTMRTVMCAGSKAAS